MCQAECPETQRIRRCLWGIPKVSLTFLIVVSPPGAAEPPLAHPILILQHGPAARRELGQKREILKGVGDANGLFTRPPGAPRYKNPSRVALVKAQGGVRTQWESGRSLWMLWGPGRALGSQNLDKFHPGYISAPLFLLLKGRRKRSVRDYYIDLLVRLQT